MSFSQGYYLVQDTLISNIGLNSLIDIQYSPRILDYYRFSLFERLVVDNNERRDRLTELVEMYENTNSDIYRGSHHYYFMIINSNTVRTLYLPTSILIETSGHDSYYFITNTISRILLYIKGPEQLYSDYVSFLIKLFIDDRTINKIMHFRIKRISVIDYIYKDTVDNRISTMFNSVFVTEVRYNGLPIDQGFPLNISSESVGDYSPLLSLKNSCQKIIQVLKEKNLLFT